MTQQNFSEHNYINRIYSEGVSQNVSLSDDFVTICTLPSFISKNLTIAICGKWGHKQTICRSKLELWKKNMTQKVESAISLAKDVRWNENP